MGPDVPADDVGQQQDDRGSANQGDRRVPGRARRRREVQEVTRRTRRRFSCSPPMKPFNLGLPD